MDIVLGIAVGVILGVIFTYLFAHRLFVLQRKRKRLGYEVLSADIVIPFESKPGGGLQVTVKKQLIADDGESISEEYVPAGIVFGFRVLLRNIGNETLENQTVHIKLDDRAKIVATEIESLPPGRSDTDIVRKRDSAKPYVSTCTFLYINEDEEFIVSIQSLRNKSMECKVFALGPAVKVHDLAIGVRRLRKLATGLMLFGTGLFLWGIVVGLAIYGWDSKPSDVLADRPIGPLVYAALGLGFVIYMVGVLLALLSVRGLRRRTSRQPQQVRG